VRPDPHYVIALSDLPGHPRVCAGQGDVDATRAGGRPAGFRRAGRRLRRGDRRSSSGNRRADTSDQRR
jgi:hypothetical protein